MNSSRLIRLCGIAFALTLWAPPAQSADLHGSVVLDGPAPAPETVVIEPKTGVHSTEGCGSLEKGSSKLRVSPEGGVRDAVVWVEDAPTAVGTSAGEAAENASPPLLVDQKECVFSPHVVATAAGGSVAIRNSDGVIHNIRIFREGNPSMLMHRWQKADAADIPWRFEEAGRYVVRCGVHPWMYAWVFVAPHRAVAVTDESGRFVLAGVAPGRHTLRVWHETLGQAEVAVEVGPEGERIDAIRFPATKGPTAEGG
ncbi:MAG: hypothetical protein HYZ95_01405 [Candidatus Omnitrophica bacterium]|nr:hypothetical protein [Candidatus Omnitrophota bacterium]